MFVGINFTVRLHDYFKFTKLVEDNMNGGIIHFDFSALREFEKMDLSSSAVRLLNEPNAGGNSVISEVLSFEMFYKCFNSTLLKTEMEVAYYPEGGSMTDYVCTVFGAKMGVSVTRAMKYIGEYTEDDGEALLKKKLKGVNQSTRNSKESWNKQILHVWAQNKHVANIIIKVYNLLPEELTSNTVVVVTTAARSGFVFKNK